MRCLLPAPPRRKRNDRLPAHAQVTPVIGVIDAGVRSQLQASEAEVEAIFDCPLEMFLADTSAHNYRDVWWNEKIEYR